MEIQKAKKIPKYLHLSLGSIFRVCMYSTPELNWQYPQLVVSLGFMRYPVAASTKDEA